MQIKKFTVLNNQNTCGPFTCAVAKKNLGRGTYLCSAQLISFEIDCFDGL